MKEQRFKFTKERLDAIAAPDSGRATYYDLATPGLLIRVSENGVKSFEVRKKVKSRAVRATLGRYPAMTIEHARRQAITHLGKMLDGVNPNKEKKAERIRGVSLQECLDDYLRIRGRNLANNTRVNYRAIVENHLADWLKKPLRDISRDMVAHRHQRIADGTADKPSMPVAANNAMRILRALFNFASGQYEAKEGESLFPDNPVKRISHTRAWVPERRRQTIIKTSDLPSWFDALDVLRAPSDENILNSAVTIADYLEFVLFSGLRRDDALCLLWDQVDLKAGVIHPVIHKKSRTVMSFPVSDHITKLLRRRYDSRVNEFVFHGRLDSRKEIGRLDEPKRQIARMIAMTGIKFSSHDLRRTFITVAESLDLSTFALKRLCSHSDGGDVTAGYIVMDVERLRAPIIKIADHLLTAAGRLPSSKIATDS